MAWAQRYAGGERLPGDQVLELLRKRLEVRLLRNSSVGEVRVRSESPTEAAAFANRIAETYCPTFAANGAEIIDRAVPGLRPARPNQPLNIMIGISIGCLLGRRVGAGVLFLTRARRA